MSFTATKFAPSPLPLNSTTPRSNDKPLSFSFDHSKTNPSSSFLGSTRKLLRFRALAKPRAQTPAPSPVAAVLLQETSNLVPFLLLSSLKNPCFLLFCDMGLVKKVPFFTQFSSLELDPVGLLSWVIQMLMLFLINYYLGCCLLRYFAT